MEDTHDAPKDIAPGQSWKIHRFIPEDAEGVARLFRSVYADAYPIATYTDPRLLIQENAASRVISSVAKTPIGDIVGHNALFNSAPHPGTYESGAGVVHSAYRGGKGIFTEMVAHGLELAQTLPGVDAVFGEPVCNHIFSQKLVAKMGFVTRALEVDLMPAAAYEKEGSAKGRVSAFLGFKTFQPFSHAVYFPAPYAEDLHFFYEAFEDLRYFRLSKEHAPPETSTGLRHQYFDFAKVARVSIPVIGEDFAEKVAALERTLNAKGVLVIQIWLNLACSWVGSAVEDLRTAGYFVGGLLPRWFGTDGLLMQKIGKRPDWEGIQMATIREEQLVKRVRADWERSQKENAHGD